MTRRPALLHVLRLLQTRLDEAHVTWAVTGSTGFALQGLPVEPHDIDLQTDASGAYAIMLLFAESVLRPVAFSGTDRIRSHFGALLIGGIEVEIMGDLQKRQADGAWEEPAPLAGHRRFVASDGLRLPVLSLEYEYHAYLALGRLETATMLRHWLDRQAASAGNPAGVIVPRGGEPTP